MSTPRGTYYTTEEVAERYQVTIKTVRSWVHRGELKVHDFGRGNRRIWRFSEADLAAFEASRVVAA